jgi:hypothetical protein
MNRGEKLTPKKHKSEAIAYRKEILQRIAARASIKVDMSPRFTLDMADAAILAITPALSSLQTSAIAKIEYPPEGRFLVALDQIDGDWFARSALS